MTMAYETAYAKINLALHVRHKRPDGYHDLETLFAFADDGDQIEAELADALTLDIGGEFGHSLEPAGNLIVRAATQMQAHFGINQGASIRLGKRLPIASGIGGGSADAAAAARLLNRLWGIAATDHELEQVLAPLGADIPACVQSKTAFGKGIGTDLVRVDNSEIAGRPLLLVNPRVAVATGPVFAAWNGKDLGPLNNDDPWRAALTGRNDLEPPATMLFPIIGEVIRLLLDTGADLVRMSGSGATCFALYPSSIARDQAKAHAMHIFPDFWTLASVLR